MQAVNENMEDSSMLGLTTGLDFKEPVQRPSSTSTNGSLPQLPGISNLAAVNASNNSPPMRANNLSPSAQAPVHQQHGLSLAATAPQQAQQQVVQMGHHQPTHTPTPTVVSGNQASTVPVCQNCSTSTTPLWRRDEYGAVLCNACGLFLKLHGRPRPISLKTDVIKSRNRVKTMRPDLATKKKQQQQAQQAAAQQQAQAANFGASDPNGFDLNAQLGSVTPAQRQKANGHGDNASPGSRGGTPSLYNPAITGFHTLDDSHFQSGALTGFSPNRPGSPLNGDRNMDTPQTHEQLIAANSALKTRVSELEVINELFRGRLGQLEHDEATARRGQEISGQAEAQLRAQLEDSHRRENNMKRRLDELELELKAVRDATSFIETDRPNKRARLSSEQLADRDAESVALAVEQAAANEDAEMVSVTDGVVAAAVAAAAVNVADQAHEAQAQAQAAQQAQDAQEAQDAQQAQDAQLVQDAQLAQDAQQAQDAQDLQGLQDAPETQAQEAQEAPVDATTAPQTETEAIKADPTSSTADEDANSHAAAA